MPARRGWRTVFLYDPGVNKFLVSLVNFREQRSAGHRHDGVARERPSQLLRNLKPHALGTFRIIRTEIYVNKTPSGLSGDFGAEPVDLIVGAVNSNHVGPVNERAQNLTLLKIRWNQNVASQACGSRIGGDSIREVAGGSTAPPRRSRARVPDSRPRRRPGL